ncbi:CPBP family intramembrane glutamic endopeptidase [Metabacillus rhizolycopersici]|uniref:CPBP family intramembrane metalloprotease n=1 Tax=Metabacillus rhizolycopersici TaxID=2875709 RepID=A0ABS7USI5_9BACI|nr:type II CAAX endopeptidase family protein [Metabacillus rhizolycopersici]MBZ5751265.1 CPBP family intramembrane metalloprotease [Metabacillus rhizolycopersici]
MRARYWFILLTYVLMQLSGIVGIGILDRLHIGETMTERFSYWTIFSFTLAFIIILFLLRNDRKDERTLLGEPSSAAASIGWAIGGVFLAIFAQTFAANIEINVFGVEAGSENTEMIVNVIKVTPLVIIVTSIFGPILEEIIFRKILFGVIYSKTNFIIAALISSLFFALLHGEPQHLLLYASMGFTFAFLYVKTKRIIVPIFAHVAMNTMVVIIQTVFADDIEKMMNRYEGMQLEQQVQVIIGGFLT